MLANFFESFSSISVWPALALAFFIGVKLALWWQARNKRTNPDKVNQQYFKGLNYLLDEQPDKAIEVFIEALEVDSETVELHLALGGLFRRKGQVDRATRIHQNLIARPNLTEEHRLNAICELAHDYYKAGLLDRAENLYLELKQTPLYRVSAIEGLCNIYQKQKEWQNAINIMKLYKRAERASLTHRVSHYWCELAQLAINDNQFDDAKKYLRSAVNEDRTSSRAILLRGQVYYKQGDYLQAINLWQSLTVSNEMMVEHALIDTINCYQKLNDIDGLRSYLLELTIIPKNSKVFSVWLNALIDVLGNLKTNEKIINFSQLGGLKGPVSSFLLDLIDKQQLSADKEKELLKKLLKREKNNNFQYTCKRCGFDAKAMHWHCPNCGDWDTFI